MANVQDSHFATSFGAFIRDGRLAKNLYQSDVADHLNLTQSYYSCLESGKRNIDLGLAMKICSFLDLDLGSFLKSYEDQ